MALASRRRSDDQSPFGDEATGPNPTDRAQGGAKREILTDGGGIPLAVAVDGANRPDCKLLEATLNHVEPAGPDPRQEEQNLCLDKGFNYPFVEDLVDDYGYTAHIRSRGEEKKALEQIPG